LLLMLVGGSIAGVVDVAAVMVLVLAIHFKWLPVWAIVMVAAVVGGVGM